jgi:DNA-binding transcriptional LysR family regulator
MSRVTIVNLETLCWIARLGSFTAAAERLNTTQPAVSKRIKDLEEAVGVPLFHRQGRRMELTMQGRDLVQRAQPLLSRLDEVAVFREHPEAATGTIRMGVGEIVAVTWFAQLMARLRRQMPGVNYEVEVGLTVNMRHKLEVGLLDVAILAAPVDAGQLVGTSIGNVSLLWAASAELASESARDHLTVEQMFLRYPVWCVARPSHMHPLAVEHLRRHGATHKHINTSDSVESIVRLVANGCGIAILPDCLVRDLLKSGKMACLSKELPSERLDFVIARRRDQDQVVIKHIVDVAVQTSSFIDR